jgi:hypothetical protein
MHAWVPSAHKTALSISATWLACRHLRLLHTRSVAGVGSSVGVSSNAVVVPATLRHPHACVCVLVNPAGTFLS